MEIFGAALDSFRNHLTISKFSHVNIRCEHKLDSATLNELGLTSNQIDCLLDGLGSNRGKDFRLSDLQFLSPQKILSFVAGRFSSGIHLWILFENLIRFHNLNCGEKQAEYITIGQLSTILTDNSLEELHLSARTINVLRREQIFSLSALNTYSREELLKLRNMGVTSVAEIEALLRQKGLRHESKTEFHLATELPAEIPLSELDLSKRTVNALRFSQVTKLGELLKLSRDDLRDIRQLGEKSIAEIVAIQDKFRATFAVSSNPDNSFGIDQGGNLKWGKEQLSREFADSSAIYGDILGLDVNEFSLSAFDYKSRLIFSSYVQSGPVSLGELLKLLDKSLAEMEDELEIASIVKCTSVLEREVNKYIEISTSFKLSSADRKAFIEYDEENPDESVDMLELDNATVSILGLNSINHLNFLGKRTLFDLSDLLSNSLITTEAPWHALNGIRSFFNNYGAFPNNLGLVIGMVRCADDKREEVIHLFRHYLSTLGRPFSDRDALILRLRAEKQTLDQIGARVGVSRERIRQIIRQISPHADATIDYLVAEKQNPPSLDYEAPLAELIYEYGAVYLSELAKLLNIEEGEVVQSVPKHFRKFIIDKSVPSDVTSEWSRERVAAVIRKAGTYYFPLKTTDYEYLLEIGEIEGPSVPFIYNRFGSWSAMCIEAGVESAPSRRIEYVRSWSEEELLSFVQRFILSDGTTGSGNGYDGWREEQHDHVPSGVLIRKQFGKWSVARRMALEGLRLKKGKVLKK